MQIFKILLFNPLYNCLVGIIDLVPGGDVGIAIIILTILVRLVILPLYIKSIRTQMKMKEIEPEMAQIKVKYEKDKMEQSRQTMELYKKYKINPFSTFLVLLIQLPVILSLFYVFKSSLVIDKEIIYSFISIPNSINSHFLGFIDISANKNYFLAVLTGLTQYIQMQFALPKPAKKDPNNKTQSFKDDLARSMDIQMRYVMPLMIIFISIGLPAAISIYWVTSNIIATLFEVFIRRNVRNKKEPAILTN
ncbi:MAG: YidC/Oxa1 family membrane protein insertase [Candidatus Vogelbacteria bacterium]|nr:YidC/Oxa1 family membrane protein insertase [Candidatus Vogelbacteria bacterium]